MNVVSYTKKHWFWLIVNGAALVPLLQMIWNFATSNMIDPIGEMTDITGYTGLVLLVLSVAVTPAISLTGFRKLATVRKSLGLQGFMYVVLHLLVFVGLDYGLNTELILGDALLTKRYVLVGFTAFMLLVPLAITSTKGWMKRLGKNWKRLHRLAYAAVSLGAIHFILVEKIPVEPVIWAIVIGLLLIARVPAIRKRLNLFRKFFDGTKQKSGSPTTATV